MYMKNDYCVEEKCDHQYLDLIINSSIAYHKNIVGKDLGTLKSFACIAQTISENFQVEEPKIGKSILKEL